MKKLLSSLLAAVLLVSVCSCEDGGSIGGTSSESTLSGTVNSAPFEPDKGVDYSKYDFLGRGEELTEEVEEKYSGYTAKYVLEGKSVTSHALQDKVNLMAEYIPDSASKTVTVNIDTIEVRVQCEYTSVSAESGEFAVIEFTANLPTKFIGSIGKKGDTKGEICHEGITPEGKDGVYKGKIKLTVPFVKAGDYYLNISIDSGNAGFPLLASIPFRVTEGEYTDSEFKLLLSGDWDLITADGYIDRCKKLFYNCYPRIYARFAFGDEPKTITFMADKSYDGAAYAVGTLICVGVDFANSNPRDIGFFSHELTHSAQQYGGQLNYGDDAWWTENMANYGGFRYFHWSSAEYVQVYRASDSSLQDWGYDPYGNNKWFFAYMDAKYPTVKKSDGSYSYGLIDSINRLIKNHSGSQLNDDPYDTSSKFNQVVKEITGFDCIESLRLRYVEELKNGTWAFEGFKYYTDNFLTENLPNVENPDYPQITSPVHGDKTASAKDPYTGGTNLCKDAEIYAQSGQVNASESGSKLIDGKESTKWCSTPGTLSDPSYSLDGSQQWIIIDLKEKKSFNTYTIYNTKTKEGYGNMTEWELLVSDDASAWRSVDYQPDCDRDKASFEIGSTSARYVMLKIYNADDNGEGTVRLYEFMLFNK